MTRTAVTKPEVAVVMGSDSDWPLLEPAVKTLRGFGLSCEVRVLSAHRSPGEAAEFSRSARRETVRDRWSAAEAADPPGRTKERRCRRTTSG